MNRADAQQLDAADTLAPFRDEFVIPDPEVCYLDGNSLGRLPRASQARVERATQHEWADGLVRSWHDWIDLPTTIGDALAPIIGAQPGEVMICDQTSVNLYKLAWAGLAASDRKVVVGDDSNFPSDRYVLRAVAEAQGAEYREAKIDPTEGPTVAQLEAALAPGDVGVLALSLVAFKSGALADCAAITDLAHRHGALMLWDLSHAAGAVPVALEATGSDLAIGCTYKYLNGGPGAPAFLYVRREHQERLQPPIPGWFGHDDMFAFEGQYRPAAGVRRFGIGTPPILSLRGAQPGIELTAKAGIDALRAKSIQQTELLIARFDARLAALGFTLGSPREASQRGSHVSVRHADAYAITQAMITRNIVPDFRAPDSIRLGIAPLYNSFVELWDAVEAIADIVESDAAAPFRSDQRSKVT